MQEANSFCNSTNFVISNGGSTGRNSSSILVSTILERVREASPLAVYGKTSPQKYRTTCSMKGQTEEEGYINSSKSKEDSVQVMEQVIDSECIASVMLQMLNSCWGRLD
ncbi:hypothetical protein RND71_003763 [Anisodus tanguticus]|uniref:Uncharacterized protein n=1 Tax=Anisodus tanguticus TaxID=243964 RepID=A0AAE1VQA0_9SOLA|nr:hypothetical protein RND71_003763 [Anisodus tanguticus]